MESRVHERGDAGKADATRHAQRCLLLLVAIAAAGCATDDRQAGDAAGGGAGRLAGGGRRRRRAGRPGTCRAGGRRSATATLTELVEQALVANPDLRIAQSRLRQARARARPRRERLPPEHRRRGRRRHQQDDRERRTRVVHGRLRRELGVGRLRRDAPGGERRPGRRGGQRGEPARTRRSRSPRRWRSATSSCAPTRRGSRSPAAASPARRRRSTSPGGGPRRGSPPSWTSSSRARTPSRHARRSRASRPLSPRRSTRLATLLGQPPAALHERLAVARARSPTVPDTVAVGIPADTLRQRPDVRAAERQLVAAIAARRRGEGRALSRAFRLSGALGAERADRRRPAQRGDGGALAARQPDGPDLLTGDASGGRSRSRREAEEQALVGYESTVLPRSKRSRTRSSRWRTPVARRVSLEAAAEASRIAAELARHRYTTGLDELPDGPRHREDRAVRRGQPRVEQGRRRSRRSIRLYKALGGGWTPAPVAEATARPQSEES